VTGEIVALKVLRRGVAKDPHEVENFRREGEVGLTLRHPNVVPIFEVAKHGKSNYLVMEFVEGRNLREFIKIRKQCQPDEAIRLMMDVASGLDYALNKGVTHRDIKLSNVLVSGRGTAKLVDFGLAGGAETSEEHLSNHANPRTIDYAALERSTGVRRGDSRSDIYFVGCMLYHLLSGEAPLPDSKNRTNRLTKARFIDITPIQKLVSGLPRAVVKVVSKAMEFEPEKRYQTPKEILIDLEAALRALSEPNPLQLEHDDDTVVEDREARAARRLKPRRTIMFVEADSKMQNVLRDNLKARGFRVLMTSDPARAISRFEEDEPPAHCLVFSTLELGEAAVDAYERFISQPATGTFPAILMLAQPHHAWESRTDDGEHHLVVKMPITIGEFREVLDQLVPHATLL
jgi:serine/threonine-protein kinase